jgi:hypothetical protein
LHNTDCIVSPLHARLDASSSGRTIVGDVEATHFLESDEQVGKIVVTLE